MLGLKLNHVSKRGPLSHVWPVNDSTHTGLLVGQAHNRLCLLFITHVFSETHNIYPVPVRTGKNIVATNNVVFLTFSIPMIGTITQNDCIRVSRIQVCFYVEIIAVNSHHDIMIWHLNIANSNAMTVMEDRSDLELTEVRWAVRNLSWMFGKYNVFFHSILQLLW